uniref:Secreted protein n=1 Tax=Anguilla anguilla TaxID=7936 RepID=A0A0E9XEY8_ANGAN
MFCCLFSYSEMSLVFVVALLLKRVTDGTLPGLRAQTPACCAQPFSPASCATYKGDVLSHLSHNKLLYTACFNKKYIWRKNNRRKE